MPIVSYYVGSQSLLNEVKYSNLKFNFINELQGKRVAIPFK